MQPRQNIYDTYWYFAYERQNIFFGKQTKDPILQQYKFTNAYRASDRTSQYLIRNVIYNGKWSEEDLLFRILFFKIFNKIETWEAFKEISWQNYNFEKYKSILDTLFKNGTVYNNAYIMPSVNLGQSRKHSNHLKLLELIMKDSKKILSSKSLEELYLNLKSYPSIGSFLAYQYSIDLNYSPLFNFSENDFVVAGPGAKRGVNKVFKEKGGKSEEEIIMHMTKIQEEEFRRLGLDFKNLFGRKLHAIDIQNLFCEVDKYCRVKFPEVENGMKRIKNRYTPKKKKIDLFYPPKWRLIV